MKKWFLRTSRKQVILVLLIVKKRKKKNEKIILEHVFLDVTKQNRGRRLGVYFHLKKATCLSWSSGEFLIFIFHY